MFVFCVAWTLGGMLETPSRKILDAHLRTIDETVMPVCDEGDTIYECRVSEQTCEWEKWTPPVWTYPQLEEDQHLDFSNLLVPTMDTTRSLYIIETMTKQCLDVLMVGGPGTAKTSTGLLYVLDLSCYNTLYVPFMYTPLYVPFIHLHGHIYTLRTPVYTPYMHNIYTEHTPLTSPPNTLYTPSIHPKLHPKLHHYMVCTQVLLIP